MFRVILSLLLMFSTAMAFPARVLIDSIPVFSSNGTVIEKYPQNAILNVLGVVGNHALLKDGYVNADFMELEIPEFTITAKVNRSILIVNKDILALSDNGSIQLKPGNVVFLGKVMDDKVFGYFRGLPVMLPLSDGNLLTNSTFDVVNFNKQMVLESNGTSVPIKRGSIGLEKGKNFIVNGFYGNIKPFKPNIDIDKLRDSLNEAIDEFNAAKYSSPLSLRLGYYVRTMPLRENDIKVIDVNGKPSVYINLRYRLFNRNGSPMNDVKTRLILKKSNFFFWKTIIKKAFKHGIDGFTEIRIFRFNGENFEKAGFIAAGTSNFNVDNPLKDAQLNLSNDLWFFTDNVYRHLEGNNS